MIIFTFSKLQMNAFDWPRRIGKKRVARGDIGSNGVVSITISE